MTVNLTRERGRPRMHDKYYLAYGSNLSREQMAFRTPDAEIIGTAMLKGWRLLFRQFATIKKSAKYNTPVLVWKISENDEKRLDRYEGFPKFYVKKNLKVNVTGLNGNDLGELKAMVYIMSAEAVKMRTLHSTPSNQYYSILREGYKNFGFDTTILQNALMENFKPVSI